MDTILQKILVVHQRQDILKKISLELEKKGYGISIASNGLDGLFAGYYDKFDLILSAIQLPKISGFEMIRALQNRSWNAGVPVIFIGTGQERSETVSLAAKLNGVILPMTAITNSISNADGASPNGDPLLNLVNVERKRQ